MGMMAESWEHGHSKGLMDVRDFLSDHSDALVHSKLMNRKSLNGVLKILDVMIERREDLRLHGGSNFELYVTESGEVS